MKSPTLSTRVQAIMALTRDGHWSHFFPGAHIGNRQIIAYLGPTNSGKTWQAIQLLKTVHKPYKGVYLAPLRLLALEVWEELRSQGIRASLITGEEQEIDPEAVIVCSTIEMLNSEEVYQKARKAPAFRPGMNSAAARRLNAAEAVCLPINFASQ